MRRRVQKWGNSLAVRIPAEVARSCALAQGTPLDVRHEAGTVVLVPERRQRRYTLRELVAKITRRKLPERPDFGPAGGREARGSRGAPALPDEATTSRRASIRGAGTRTRADAPTPTAPP